MLLTVWLGIASAAEPQRNLGIASANGEKRVALVVGNSKYPSAALRNPANDARDMAAALRKIGFDVIEKTDVTQKELNRAITQFGNKLTTDTIALFFYAGHGMQVKGKNYLIPIDAQIENEASARSETVDVDAVLDQLSASSLNVVILDACRNNPFERRFRSVGGGLAQMDAPKGTLIAYATSPGKVASDGEGRNGLYTQELLKVIQIPGLEVEKAFKRVRANVARATGDNQIPWEASSLTGEFSFSKSKQVPAAEPSSSLTPAASVDPAIVELAFWDSIKNSSEADDFQAYLDKYPRGQFVGLAERRVRKGGGVPLDSLTTPAGALQGTNVALAAQTSSTSVVPKATIYVLRKRGFLPSGHTISVQDGEVVLGTVGDGTYFKHQIDAGEKSLTAVPNVQGGRNSRVSKTIRFESGKTYYILVDAVWGPRWTIEVVDDDQGKDILRRLAANQSAPNESAATWGK